MSKRKFLIGLWIFFHLFAVAVFIIRHDKIAKIDTNFLSITPKFLEDKDFQQTYFFNHWKDYLKNETNLIAKEKLNEFAKTKDFSSITTIDKIIDFVDEVKTIQKKEKKLGLVEDTKKAFKEQKFNFFGKEYSIQDMFDVVGEFLETFKKKQEKNK